jgi:methylmalonyl-CoA/ethylmalonyl-CoA epimerase
MHIAQVALRATDLDRAAAFYSDLLGSQPTGLFEPPGLLFFDLDGTRLMMEGNAPSSLIYLQVDDVTTTLARMRERAEIVSEPHVIFHHDNDSLGPAGADEWQAFIKDSEGNLVGLISHQHDPA